MRLIKSNNTEPEYPKRHICDECGAELEYDKEDVHIGWVGCEYVTCPNCNNESMVGNRRIMLPTWKTTFNHVCTDNKTVDVQDYEVGAYVNKTVKELCSDEYKPGEFYVTCTGNMLVVGVKWEDYVNIYVTKDYWEDSIDLDDYEMIK